MSSVIPTAFNGPRSWLSLPASTAGYVTAIMVMVATNAQKPLSSSRSGQGKNENCKKTEGSRYGQQHSVQGGVSKPRIHDGGDDTANDDAAEEKLLLTTKRIRCPGVSA